MSASEDTIKLLTRIANATEAIASHLAKGNASSAGRSGQVIPFGKTKGLPIEEASDRDLRFVLEKVRESLEDPANERYRAKNAELISAIEAELERR